MMVEQGTHRLAMISQLPTEELKEEGWRVLTLPTGVRSRHAFFEAIRAIVDLDPPIVTDASWDALSDSLWEGLTKRPEQRVAIVWIQDEAFCDDSPDDCRTAEEVLSDLSTAAGDDQLTVGSPVVVAVFLVGPSHS